MMEIDPNIHDKHTYLLSFHWFIPRIIIIIIIIIIIRLCSYTNTALCGL